MAAFRETGGRASVAQDRQIVSFAPPVCEQTRLTKPECHCAACLAALIAGRGFAVDPVSEAE